MDQIIPKSFLEKCTGCGACLNTCPTDSIVFKESHNTFLYPHINQEACIDCGKCIKVCPVNQYVNKNEGKVSVIAARAKDEIRYRSSSGGMFFLLAEYIIKEGGVVYCVNLDKKQKVKHIRIDREEDIEKGCGSKYVQSEVGLCYQEIKKDLLNEKKVLFTGCPCQVAGLNNFLGKKYENLFTVDILCHGVPSQKVFDKYLEEKRVDTITNVIFRTKKYGWRADIMTIFYEKNPMYAFSWRQGDRFEIGFQENIFLRDSCEDCKFCEFPRVADLSIGDFWGINEYLIDDQKGTSIVFKNNDKGQFLYDRIIDGLILNETIDVPVEKLKNRVFKFYPHNKNKNLFFKHLETKPFSKALDYARDEIYEIGIVGIPTVENFGGALTYLSLYNVVKSFNLPCKMIERPKRAPHPPANILVDYYVSPYGDDLLTGIKDKSELISLNRNIRKFLVGSDQLFHHNLYNNFGQICTLDWVNDNKKKIAYAASFGHDNFTGSDDERAEMSFFMKKFDAFSVREKSGVDLARNEFGVNAEYVIDPVFLSEKEVYEKIAQNAKNEYEYPHIAAYILDPNDEKAEFIEMAEEKMGIPATIFSEMFYNKQSIKQKWKKDIEIGKIEDRIANIINCNFMITDSFHGVCMAIIFHKRFIAIKNLGRGVARFESILNLLGLQDRLVFAQKELIEQESLFEEIDYEKVDSILKIEKERCLSWLRNNLFNEEKKSLSNYDIMNRRIFYANKQLTEKLNSICKYLMLDFIGETDIIKFLDKLSYSFHNNKQIAIVVGAKDTPGMEINGAIEKRLKDFGLKADFSHLHWFGYIAIMYQNTMIEEKAEFDKAVKSERVINNQKIEAISAPLHDGNVSVIKINGENYSMNGRGLNFVIFDSRNGDVLDSVVFDTHSMYYSCTRKEKNYYDRD